MATNRVTMRLEGMEDLQRAITAAPEFVRARASDVVARTTFGVSARARANVRVDTGALQSKIRPVSRGLSGRVVIDPGEVFGRRPETYWLIVEFTIQPYLRPAAEAESPELIRQVRAIGTALERGFASGRYV